MPERVIIGTRGSKLALWQAHWVKDALMAGNSGLEVDIAVIKTKGDKSWTCPWPRSVAKVYL